MYARSSQVALIVFDQSNKASYDHVPQWVSFLKDNVDIPNIFIVGNKFDLTEEVPSTEAMQYAETNEFKYIRTSAKTGDGINELFYQIAEVAYNSEGKVDKEINSQNLAEKTTESSGCC